MSPTPHAFCPAGCIRTVVINKDGVKRHFMPNNEVCESAVLAMAAHAPASQHLCMNSHRLVRVLLCLEA